MIVRISRERDGNGVVNLRVWRLLLAISKVVSGNLEEIWDEESDGA